MSDIQVFANEQFGKVRTVMIDGVPWLVGKDVAGALGYSNTKDALATHVDDDDKKILQKSEITTFENHIPKEVLLLSFVSADVPNRGLTIINESGLYSLVFSSKLPMAKEFKHWVTSEVLPSLRKHGAYMTPSTIEQVLLNPDTIIRLATDLKAEREKRIALEGKVEEDKPKVLFADAVSTAKTSILIGDMAKLLKQNGIEIGQKQLFEWLREHEYLIKRNGADWNMPTQRAMEMELFEIKETVITHADGHTSVNKTTKVTGKGQIYFVNLFLKGGKGDDSEVA